MELELINEIRHSLKQIDALCAKLMPSSSDNISDVASNNGDFVSSVSDNAEVSTKRHFDLDSFIINCNNDNVRRFASFKPIEGFSRHRIVYSAVGSLSKAGCSVEIIENMVQKYCDSLGLQITDFRKLLCGLK